MMPKLLLVGDLHAKKSSVEELQPLLDKIVRLSRDHEATIIFGDIYNDHGVTTSDVQKQIADFLSKISGDVIVFPGNHDMAGDETTHSLYLHGYQKNVKVIDSPSTVDICGQLVKIVPFLRNNDDFVRAVGDHKGLVFCHGDFNGAKYENGFYVKNGVDPGLFEGVIFVSGHIHMVSEFANVWYIGSPRWLSKSDCNQDRGVWSVEIKDSKISSKTFISSSDVVPVYVEILVGDDTPLADLSETCRVYANFSGTRKDKLKELQQKYRWVSIKHTQPVQIRNAVVSETKGIKKSVIDYVAGTTLSNKDELLIKIKERLAWA